MTIIEVLIYCCVPNFIKIGSRVRPPDAHNCKIFNAPFLGNSHCCHGNRIMADISGCDHPSFVQIGLLIAEL